MLRSIMVNKKLQLTNRALCRLGLGIPSAWRRCRIFVWLKLRIKIQRCFSSQTRSLALQPTEVCLVSPTCIKSHGMCSRYFTLNILQSFGAIFGKSLSVHSTPFVSPPLSKKSPLRCANALGKVVSFVGSFLVTI
jgi:hypothetical protein